MANEEQSRSKRGRTRPPAIRLTELKRSLKQFQSGDSSELELAERAIRADLRGLRRSVRKRLESVAADARDVDKIKAILVDYEAKRTKLLERNKIAVDKARAALDKKQALGTASRREALAALANPRLPFAPPSIVLKPILIWATHDQNRPHATILVNSHADSIGVSWAQVALNTTSLPPDGENTFRLQFWYLWENERDYYEVVNANALMIFDGSAAVTASTGIFDGGTSGVSCQATLSPMQWWESATVPDPTQATRWWNVFSIEADGGGFFSFDDVDGETLSSTVGELRYEQFVIPPGATAVILLEVSFYCWVHDGSIAIDFASTPTPADWPRTIQCQLQLELLTAPGLTGPVTFGGSPVVFG